MLKVRRRRAGGAHVLAKARVTLKSIGQSLAGVLPGNRCGGMMQFHPAKAAGAGRRGV